MTEADTALLELLHVLQDRGYQFVTPTPATHARVVKRPGKQRARSLRDVFGWSLPFEREVLDSEILDLMQRGEILEPGDAGFKSKLRVSSLGDLLFLHSAYPTEAEDSVFFGPDSYRFARFIEAQLSNEKPVSRLVDIGAGAGVGAIAAAGLRPDARIVMTDINPKALRLARINAAFAGVEAETVEGEGLDGVEGKIDLALTNPPYIVDDSGRDYRDGGGMHGGRISLDLAKAAMARLAPGGRLLLYTGSAIVDGEDRLRRALEQAADSADCSLRYEELDPDVFGEELDRDAYADVDRIAVVGAVAVKRR